MKTRTATAMRTAARAVWARKACGVAAVTLLCGVGVASGLRPAATMPPAQTARPPAAAAEEAGAFDWGRSPEGEEWKRRYNGIQLRLDYPRLGERELADAKVEALPSGGQLVAAGNTISLFHGPSLVWRHEEPQPIFDFAYVEGPGLVYVTAGDNQMFILEAWSGRERHRESRNGRAAFGQTVAFGKDLCLVTDDNSGYRSTEDFIPPMDDGVSAWRGTRMLWHQNLPPDAEVRVGGGRILAVTRTRTRVLVTDITPPAAVR